MKQHYSTIEQDTLNFAIIGASNRAHDHSDTLTSMGLSRRLVCDLNDTAARDHAAKHGYERHCAKIDELLDNSDIDAVIIVLPQMYAADAVVKCLQAGKHVLTEKPLCTTWEDAKRIHSAAKASSKICMVSHNHRFGSATIIRDALRDQRIGKPFLVDGTLISPPDYYGGRSGYGKLSPKNPSAVTLGNGIHGFDLLRYWLGEVESISSQFVGGVIGDLGLDAEDTSVHNIRFRSGAVGNFVVSDGDVSIRNRKWGFSIFGKEGVVRWPDGMFFKRDPACLTTSRSTEGYEGVSLISPEVKAKPQLELVYEHFIASVLGETECLSSYREAAASLAVVLASIESNRLGGVPVDPSRYALE
jgi:UDP-N-acetyl-2-amino-2-deoxyglucuronate dehydrogenase